MYETIKKFLAEGGKCLLIEDGKIIGVVLTMAEYEKLQNKSLVDKPEEKPEVEKSLFSEINLSSQVPPVTPLPEASVAIEDIGLADDITLEDLGLDQVVEF